jgi:hypothetical protein
MRSFVLESMATSGSSIRPSWAEEPDWAEASPWISERITFRERGKTHTWHVPDGVVRDPRSADADGPPRLMAIEVELTHKGRKAYEAGRGDEGVRYGYDAGRMPIRFAESCHPADVALAARLTPALDRFVGHPAARDLGGAPLPGEESVVAAAAKAAALAAAAKLLAPLLNC